MDSARRAKQNKRNTVRIAAFGREMLQADWARLLGVNPSHIWYATNKGKGIEWLAARRGIEFEGKTEAKHGRV